MEHSVAVLDSALVSDAVVWWTGWVTSRGLAGMTRPLSRGLGENSRADLLPAIKGLDSDFYASDARHSARALAEMGAQAAADFRLLHPEVAEDAVQALAWCYTFDFK